MTYAYIGPLFTIACVLGIAAGIVLIASLWNLIRAMISCSPTKARQVPFLAVARVSFETEEINQPEEIKIWTPGRSTQ